MSRAAADGDLAAVRATTSPTAWRLTGVGIVLAAAALVALGPDLTGVLYAAHRRADGARYIGAGHRGVRPRPAGVLRAVRRPARLLRLRGHPHAVPAPGRHRRHQRRCWRWSRTPCCRCAGGWSASRSPTPLTYVGRPRAVAPPSCAAGPAVWTGAGWCGTTSGWWSPRCRPALLAWGVAWAVGRLARRRLRRLGWSALAAGGLVLLAVYLALGPGAAHRGARPRCWRRCAAGSRAESTVPDRSRRAAPTADTQSMPLCPASTVRSPATPRPTTAATSCSAGSPARRRLRPRRARAVRRHLDGHHRDDRRRPGLLRRAARRPRPGSATQERAEGLRRGGRRRRRARTRANVVDTKTSPSTPTAPCT